MTSDYKRPGGLTALAVFNFIGGGFGMLGMAGLLLVTATKPMVQKHMEENQRAAASRVAEMNSEEPGAESRRAKAEEALRQQEEAQRMFTETPTGLIALKAGVGGLNAILLIVSGIGYLKMRRCLGRTVGSLYAVISIVWSAIELGYIKDKYGGDAGGGGLLSLLNFLYPVITIILVNTVFKDDFVNE